MITFTPLSGAARSSRTTPLAYILQVDDVRILLDCGSPDWSPEDSSSSSIKSEDIQATSYHWEEYCQRLREYAPTIDLVLLSHGDLSHCGLYAFANARWGLKAPTYTTLPVQAMGRIATTEDVEGLRDQEDVGDPVEQKENGEDGEAIDDEGPENGEHKMEKPSRSGKCVASLTEVHDAFDSVNTLRYSQPTHLQGKCQGLTITPFNAGHTLGGTIWKIRSPSAGTILYAVDMNHMKERHLDGTVLMHKAAGGVFEPLARPDLLITDADRAAVVTSKRKDRESSLIDTITTTLGSRSSVLVPCDSSTRLLELLVLLDQHWTYQRLRFPIVLLSRTGEEMLAFVRSMMEWLGGTVSKEDVGEEGTGGRQQNKRKRDDANDEDALGAFALRFNHLEIVMTPQALLQRYSSKEPKLILAVPVSLSHGPSRSIFTEFAAIPDNVLLLTSRSEEGTLGRNLFNRWNNSQREESKWDKGKIGSNVMLDGSLKLTMKSKVPLQGAELEAFQEKERAVKDKKAAHQAEMARNQRMLEADEDDSDSDSDSDDEDEVARALDDDTMDIADNGIGAADAGRRRKGDRGGDGADWVMDGDEGLTKQLLSYDIYIKGNVSKATTFFKSAGGQTQRFRMFPYVEKKRRVDEYGETIDIGMWLRKGKVLAEDAESEETKEAQQRQEADDEAKKAIREPPSKFVSSEIEIQLACRLLFVDMDGLNDGRAVKTIVPQVNPRKMIIVHAPSDATDTLIESCGNIRAMTKDIFAPAVGENVRIGQQTNTFSISLTDELLSSIKMSRFEDNEVGFVTGRVTSHASSTIAFLEPVAPSNLPDVELASAPRGRTLGSRPAAPLKNSTMIGELKLTSLKSRLLAVGVQAELIGEGVLICGAAAKKNQAPDMLEESVAVRKTARGKVELEGNVSDVYYVVRREIYNLHALVAA
ncbi:hypothetical protein HWV62_7878 [Athelia sp. TMB]|nr:hypothetical protein HWV62_7878 [Athelia sp. TMB]